MFVAFGQAGKDEKGWVRHSMARYYATRSIVLRNRERVNRLKSSNRANSDTNDTQTGIRCERPLAGLSFRLILTLYRAATSEPECLENLVLSEIPFVHPGNLPKTRPYGHFNFESQMSHPLQSHYDRVSAQLRGLMNSLMRTNWNSRFTRLVTPSWRTHSTSLQPKF
jgi:hypothetical protein